MVQPDELTEIENEVCNKQRDFDEKVADKSKTISQSPVIEVGGKFRHFLDKLDEYLRVYAPLREISVLLGVRISILFLGTCAIIIFSLRYGWGNRIICDYIGTLYPAWMTFKTIEYPHEDRARYWLTYWLMYSFFILFQHPLDLFFYWVPFYSPAKIFALLWLYLPMFQGSQLMYALIRPHLLKNSVNIDKAVYNLKGAVGDAVEAAKIAVVEKIVDNSINSLNLDGTDDLDVPMKDEVTLKKISPHLLKNSVNIDKTAYNLKDVVEAAKIAVVEKIVDNSINSLYLDGTDDLDVPMKDEVTLKKIFGRNTL